MSAAIIGILFFTLFNRFFSFRPAENCEYGSLEEEEDSLVWGEGTLFESLLNSAAFVISRRQFPGGVLIVLAARSSDQDCHFLSAPEPPADRRVNISLTVQLQPDLRLESTLAVFAFYAVSCLFAVIISVICFR